MKKKSGLLDKEQNQMIVQPIEVKVGPSGEITTTDKTIPVQVVDVPSSLSRTSMNWEFVQSKLIYDEFVDGIILLVRESASSPGWLTADFVIHFAKEASFYFTPVGSERICSGSLESYDAKASLSNTLRLLSGHSKFKSAIPTLNEKSFIVYLIKSIGVAPTQQLIAGAHSPSIMESSALPAVWNSNIVILQFPGVFHSSYNLDQSNSPQRWQIRAHSTVKGVLVVDYCAHEEAGEMKSTSVKIFLLHTKSKGWTTKYNFYSWNQPSDKREIPGPTDETLLKEDIDLDQSHLNKNAPQLLALLQAWGFHEDDCISVMSEDGILRCGTTYARITDSPLYTAYIDPWERDKTETPETASSALTQLRRIPAAQLSLPLIEEVIRELEAKLTKKIKQCRKKYDELLRNSVLVMELAPLQERIQTSLVFLHHSVAAVRYIHRTLNLKKREGSLQERRKNILKIVQSLTNIDQMIFYKKTVTKLRHEIPLLIEYMKEKLESEREKKGPHTNRIEFLADLLKDYQQLESELAKAQDMGNIESKQGASALWENAVEIVTQFEAREQELGKRILDEALTASGLSIPVRLKERPTTDLNYHILYSILENEVNELNEAAKEGDEIKTHYYVAHGATGYGGNSAGLMLIDLQQKRTAAEEAGIPWEAPAGMARLIRRIAGLTAEITVKKIEVEKERESAGISRLAGNLAKEQASKLKQEHEEAGQEFKRLQAVQIEQDQRVAQILERGQQPSQDLLAACQTASRQLITIKYKLAEISQKIATLEESAHFHRETDYKIKQEMNEIRKLISGGHFAPFSANRHHPAVKEALESVADSLTTLCEHRINEYQRLCGSTPRASLTSSSTGAAAATSSSSSSSSSSTSPLYYAYGPTKYEYVASTPSSSFSSSGGLTAYPSTFTPPTPSSSSSSSGGLTAYPSTFVYPTPSSSSSSSGGLTAYPSTFAYPTPSSSFSSSRGLTAYPSTFASPTPSSSFSSLGGLTAYPSTFAYPTPSSSFSSSGGLTAYPSTFAYPTPSSSFSSSGGLTAYPSTFASPTSSSSSSSSRGLTAYPSTFAYPGPQNGYATRADISHGVGTYRTTY